jgi:hypothetical protein
MTRHFGALRKNAWQYQGMQIGSRPPDETKQAVLETIRFPLKTTA